MAYIKYKDGKNVLKADEIDVDDMDVQRIDAAAMDTGEMTTQEVTTTFIYGEPDISASYIHAANHIDSVGGYQEDGVWYEQKWGIG